MQVWATPQFATVRRRLGEAEAWVVGGATRDWLLARPVADVDVVVRGAGQVARQVARALSSTLVVLEDGIVYRVVCSSAELGRGPLFDFCELRGECIQDDLALRDFTVNAIAHPLATFPPSDDQGWIDPFGGRADLQARRLRGVAAASFHRDPLRCLRAFRFAVELGFEIEESTRGWIAAASAELQGVAGERLWQECLRLLEGPGTAGRWREMADLGIAQQLLPGLAWDRGAGREQVLANFDRLLDQESRRGRSWELQPNPAAVRLAVLAWDGEGATLAELAARLRLSRREREIVAQLGPCSREVLQWVAACANRYALWEIYRRYPLAAELALLLSRVLAEVSGTWVCLEHWEEAVHCFRGPFRQALDHPLLSGGDVLASTGRVGGPWLGRLLAQLATAQALGEVRTREEAVEWLQRHVPSL